MAEASSELPGAALRMAADRFIGRVSTSISLLLLAWLVIGFFRDPPASWAERSIVTIFMLASGLLPAFMLLYRTTLPALDRTPRLATVTGRESWNTEPDGDGVIDPYDLILVTVELNGHRVESRIADIIAPESIDRFSVGSTWTVHAFLDDPLALNEDRADTRVILTAEHEDVIRDGYNLVRFTLRGSHGPGSELLLRRFANDDRRSSS